MDRMAQAISGLKEAAARAKAASDGLDTLRRQAEDVSRALSALDGVAAQARVLSINLAIGAAARAGAVGPGLAASAPGADSALAKRAGEAAGQVRGVVELWAQSSTAPGEAIGTCLRLLEDVCRLVGDAAQWLERAEEAAARMEEQAQQVTEAAQAAGGCVDGLLRLASAPAEGPSSSQQAGALAQPQPFRNSAGQGYY